MKTFNLNEQTKTLPFAFRQMLSALLESHHTIAQYTQPSVLRMLEHGTNPVTVGHPVLVARRSTHSLRNEYSGRAFSRWARERRIRSKIAKSQNSSGEIPFPGVLGPS